MLRAVPVLSMLAAADEAEFMAMVVKVAITGLLAFAVSGGLLWAFFRSLQREHNENQPQFTRRSAALLGGVIASLLAFSLLFAIMAYR